MGENKNKFLIYVSRFMHRDQDERKALSDLNEIGTVHLCDDDLYVIQTDKDINEVYIRLHTKLKTANYFVAEVAKMSFTGNAQFGSQISHLDAFGIPNRPAKK
jgi:hypothetical protein